MLILDLLVAGVAGLLVFALRSPAGASPEQEESVDVAEWGFPFTGEADGAPPVYSPSLTGEGTPVELPAAGWAMLEWRRPRDVYRVRLEGDRLPPPDSVRLEYWHHIWPDGGGGGWQRLDDPFNGRWVAAHCDVEPGDGSLTFILRPLSTDENPSVERTGFEFRRTYRVRAVFDRPVSLSALKVFTDAVWREAELDLEWKPSSEPRPGWSGPIEGRSAHILDVRTPGRDGADVTLRVRYSHAPDRLSEDRGHVVFRAGGCESFSVFVDDVLREGGIYVRDIDAFVSDGSRGLRYRDWKPSPDCWEGTIMDLVARMPEQSLERVMRAIPLKPPREAHLGAPHLRQEFTILANGDVELLENSLRSPGRDRDRRPWTVRSLRYSLSTLRKPQFTEDGGRQAVRHLEEGWLPVIHTEWENEGLRFHREAFAVPLLEPIAHNVDGRRGDEPLVLLEKLTVSNPSAESRTAWFWTEFSLKRPLTVTPDGVLRLDAPSEGEAPEGLTPVRGRIDTGGRGELRVVEDCVPAVPGSPDPQLEGSDAPRQALLYTVELGPGESHSIRHAITYIELLDAAEMDALLSQDYDARHAEVVSFWKERTSRGMQLEVPDAILNDLYRANLWHVLITTDRDPDTGLYQHGAATVRYANFANETCMVAQSLEMRGEHEEAARLLEPFIVCQGKKPLPGNFRSQEGLLYAAHPDPENDPYTAQGYNMHHGWVLWKLAEHYFYTLDRDYLERVAPVLVAACDWVTRERQATMAPEPDGSRPVEWGLAPPGDLEDVEEYLFWYATNAYYHAGMAAAGRALKELGHPEADRILREAEEYRRDILDSVRESIAGAPVVRLKDGTWIPYVPPRTRVLTHRKEGWIREGLYPSLHLLDGEVVEPAHRVVEWMMQDLEDNIFLSRESGYNVQDERAGFFDFGGVNLQPCLCPNAMAHLRRDEVPHFIRVFYNTLWASLYPDTVCFAEWVPHFGRGGGPLYKTPDECKFIQFMRNMLVLEEGDGLLLGMGVPRAWMQDGREVRLERGGTFFGTVSLHIRSFAASGRIEASLDLPSRSPAASAVLRLRHPEGLPMKRVEINGAEHAGFDPERELIVLPATSGRMDVRGFF